MACFGQIEGKCRKCRCTAHCCSRSRNWWGEKKHNFSTQSSSLSTRLTASTTAKSRAHTIHCLSSCQCDAGSVDVVVGIRLPTSCTSGKNGWARFFWGSLATIFTDFRSFHADERYESLAPNFSSKARKRRGKKKSFNEQPGGVGGIAVSHTNTVNQWSKWEFSGKIYIAGNKSIIFMYKTRLHSDSQLAMYIHSSYSEKRRQKKSMPESAEKPKPNKSWKNIFRGSLAQAFKRSSSVLIFFFREFWGERRRTTGQRTSRTVDEESWNEILNSEHETSQRSRTLFGLGWRDVSVVSFSY